MSEVGGTLIGQLGKQSVGHSLKSPRVLGRDRVPELGLSIVEIVDRMQVHVLSVPSKSGLPHAEVEVSRVHSSNRDVVVFVHAVQYRSEPLDIPHLF